MGIYLVSRATNLQVGNKVGVCPRRDEDLPRAQRPSAVAQGQLECAVLPVSGDVRDCLGNDVAALLGGQLLLGRNKESSCLFLEEEGTEFSDDGLR